MFKVGEKVRIIDAQENLDLMKTMIGNICTIKEVDHNSHHVYRLKEDIYQFGWFEWWLESAEPAEITEKEIELILGE